MLTYAHPIYYQGLEDDTFGYSDVLIPAIVTHLTATYFTLTASDIETNQGKLTKACNTNDPIENLRSNIKIIRSISTQGSKTISDETTIQLILLALEKTYVHSHAIKTCHNKD